MEFLQMQVEEIQRYFGFLERDVVAIKGPNLAPIRMVALSARLRLLCQAAVLRASGREGETREIDPSRLSDVKGLLSHSLDVTSLLLSSNLVRLFVERNVVGNRIWQIHVRISDTASHLGISILPYGPIEHGKHTESDLAQFDESLAPYAHFPSQMSRLVASIRRRDEMQDLHARLQEQLHNRPLAELGVTSFSFASKASKALELQLAHTGIPRSTTLPPDTLLSAERRSTMPSAFDIRASLGTLPPLPKSFTQTPGAAAWPTQRSADVHSVGTSTGSKGILKKPGDGSRFGAYTQPALQPNHVHFQEVLQPDHERVRLPPPMSMPSISGSSFDDVAESSHHDPLVFAPIGSDEYIRRGSSDLFALLSPAASGSSGQMVSRLSGRGMDTTIDYFDEYRQRNVDWKPFSHWLWRVPHAMERAFDSQKDHVQSGSVVRLISLFSTINETLAHALLDHVTGPSRGPPPLRDVAIHERLRVLQIFDIRNVIWLACVSLDRPGPPGFVPLQATALQANRSASPPKKVATELHSGARTFEATLYFKSLDAAQRKSLVMGIVTTARISWKEAIKGGTAGAASRWFHFPYDMILSLEPTLPAELLVVLRDEGVERGIRILFKTETESQYFVADVERMRSLSVRRQS